jgi:antitoxin component YwqK of YwqJK toxin-antitoxin module
MPKAETATATNPEAAETIEARNNHGALLSRATLQNGLPHGNFTEFGPQGQATLKMQFEAGQRHGPLAATAEDGTDLAHLHFSNGVLEGPATFFAQGRKIAEITHAGGAPNGPFRAYAPSGEISSEGTLRAGRLHGVLKIFRPDGTAQKTLTYADGVLHGEALDLDPNGTVRRRATYHAGHLHGTVTDYNEAGTPTAITQFSDGKKRAAPSASPAEPGGKPPGLLEKLGGSFYLARLRPGG